MALFLLMLLFCLDFLNRIPLIGCLICYEFVNYDVPCAYRLVERLLGSKLKSDFSIDAIHEVSLQIYD